MKRFLWLAWVVQVSVVVPAVMAQESLNTGRVSGRVRACCEEVAPEPDDEAVERYYTRGDELARVSWEDVSQDAPVVAAPEVQATNNAATAAPLRMAEHPVELDADRKPSLVTGGSCLLRNATIHSAVRPPYVGDVLILNGKIAQLGSVEAPQGVLVLDAAGRHLAPGVVDCHSHMAIDGGLNEGSVSISCDVTIADVVDGDDVAVWRAVAAGVTTARLLHGSANTIGGRDAVIKLKYGRRPAEMMLIGAPEGVKFALGENPKRATRGGGAPGRFPNTRMGVEALVERAFEAADDYRAAWRAYAEAQQRGEDRLPPRRDLRLEALSKVLDKSILVHAHCYRADEIVMLLRSAQRHGYTIATLQHVLEGYKVAPEMAAAGVAGSTFGDWWAYKVEAYDGIPHNAALMERAGVLSSLNSDSDEMIRRLMLEAAKSVRYEGMDPVAALRLVTLNPAKQLGLGERLGSIEVGKDADMALYTHDPLDARAVVLWTMIDGEVAFERRDAFELLTNPPKVRDLTPEPMADLPVGEGALTAIVGGTVHPVGAPVIEKGVVLVQGGRILAVGANVPVPAQASIHDATGRHVWPGMIALKANIGLLEIGAVAATDDQAEIGGNQPDLRTAASIHPDSAHVGVTRYNGITRAQVAPQGGGPFMGQSCVAHLVGDTWEEMVQVDRDMLHLAFPVKPAPTKPGAAKDAPPQDAPNGRRRRTSSDHDERVAQLRRMLDDAREYGRRMDAAKTGSVAPAFDARLAALVPYARAEKPVALHANDARTILAALRFAKDEKLNAVLYGAAEGWKVVDVLARAEVPVVIGPVLALPNRREDPYDAAYANAAVLARAGVRYAIMADDPENTRNLPFHAAMAAAHGLPHEEAVRAVTLYPAQILGLDKQVGSLAPGKVADIVVTDGDLLDVRAPVTALWIGGRSVPLENRQTQLADRYRARIDAYKSNAGKSDATKAATGTSR